MICSYPAAMPYSSTQVKATFKLVEETVSLQSGYVELTVHSPVTLGLQFVKLRSRVVGGLGDQPPFAGQKPLRKVLIIISISLLWQNVRRKALVQHLLA